MAVASSTVNIVDLSLPTFPSCPTVNANPGADVVIKLACTIPELRALLILEHGHVVAEYTRSNVESTVAHNLISTTKSWLGLIIGMMIQDGLVRLDETLGDIFTDPDAWRLGTEADLDCRKSITVKELLAMTSGLQLPPTTFDADGNEKWSDGGGTLSEALLEPALVRSTAQPFHYLGANNILSYIVSHKTDFASPREYMEAKVFPWLGISSDAISWQQNKEGMELAFYGLSMTTTHMAKLGQLFLQGGRSSAAHSLIHGDWVTASTCLQSGNTDYGYLWWVYPTMFCAQGLGGQDVCVSPLTDRVIVQQRDFNSARGKDDAGSAMGLAALALSTNLLFTSNREPDTD